MNVVTYTGRLGDSLRNFATRLGSGLGRGASSSGHHARAGTPMRDKPSGGTAGDNPGNQCLGVHQIVESLPLYRDFRSANGELPADGIYFFFEEGELCARTQRPRIVRVGINKKQGRLVSRLRNHGYGGGRSSLGKDASAFRMLLGDALLRRSDPDHPCLVHWNDHMSRSAKACADCHRLEQDVSEHLVEKMSFRVLSLDDGGQRERLEGLLVGLLAMRPCCQPSVGWLGNHSGSEKVRRSGLWNREHTGSGRLFSASEMNALRNIFAEERGADAAARLSSHEPSAVGPTPARIVVRERPYGENHPSYLVIEFDDGTIEIEVRHANKRARQAIESHLTDRSWFLGREQTWLQMAHQSRAFYHLGRVVRDYRSFFKTGRFVVRLCEPSVTGSGPVSYTVT